MPQISIIVPVYNVENYIQRCIDSILAQTFKDFELILVNDGSPDQSGVICDQYAEKDKRIRVIHKKNGGLSDARNAGLKIAKGDFVGFVDSDDYIEFDMYEELLKACIANNSKISMCGRYNVYENGIIPSYSFEGYKIWERKEAIGNLLTWNNIDSSVCDKLFKKDLFKNIEFPLGKYNEDIFIMTQLIHNAKKIVHIGIPKYYYFHRTNSITTEPFTIRKLDLLEANQKVVDLINNNYADLKDKAVSFQLEGIIYLLGLLQTKQHQSEFKKEYDFLRNQARKNTLKILRSPYIRKKLKIKSVMMSLGIFSTLKSIKLSFATKTK